MPRSRCPLSYGRTAPQAALRSVLNFDEEWPRFIPRQVNGRAVIDAAGMPDRVTELVRRLLAGIE